MKTILITGAKGFLGRNLAAALAARDDIRVLKFDIDNTEAELQRGIAEADVIFHLAGVNRPKDVAEFDSGNAGSTELLCRLLENAGRSTPVIFSSSIQAERDNPYGNSKRRAENALREYARRSKAKIAIFRFKNIFGKWCRPNYNSVVATFCHNIARDLPIDISDPQRALELVHVDDAIAAMSAEMDNPREHPEGVVAPDPIPSYSLTLGDLADRIRFFRAMRKTMQTPDFSVRFNRQLYSTYLSYVEPRQAAYGLDIKRDPRGSLAEFIKSPHFGQIFVSRTVPGVTRGNHFHRVKTEKFLVLSGEGLIRLRRIDDGEIHEFRVRGEDYRVVDIPPGFTHSITNVGETEMVTLFWASEVFDSNRADTYFMPVDVQRKNTREAA
ncbi:MAG: NAD-dependent epimerase/dehydratase family protein [Pirellulales bacterium]|nr:NAD-dependent epimerase/dehydratase family protein [Pirellulales bacterium]